MFVWYRINYDKRKGMWFEERGDWEDKEGDCDKEWSGVLERKEWNDN